MILVENILKKYNAIGINIPKFMIKWMRSNHAGETGAVWIYKGASCIFWNKKISKMSKEHILTETNHLIVMENLLTSNEKSKLLFLWRIMGFVLGFLSAMFGYKFFCITVDAVETFVEKHYNEQIEYLLNNNSEKWFEDYGTELKNNITKVMNDSDIDVKITGIPSGPIIQFNSDDNSEVPLMKTLFVQEMAKQGIHMSTVFHPTMSHTAEDIKITAEAIEKSLLVIDKAKKSSFEDYLEAPILNEPFRRLVK